MSTDRPDRHFQGLPSGERFLLRLGTALAGTNAVPNAIAADFVAGLEREKAALERYREHLSREVTTVDERLEELRALLGQ
jgi:hypothetical protein